MSLRQDDLCPDHPEEKLRFVCLVCDVLICRDCKLTDHEGHRSIDVSKAVSGIKEKLGTHRSRLQERLRTLDNVLREVAEDQTAAAGTKSRLERKIRNRVATVTSWLKEAEEAALRSLTTTASQVDRDLSATRADLEQRRQQVQDMMAEVDSMVTNVSQALDPASASAFSPASALRLEQDMRIGRGHGERLERLTEGLPNYSVTCLLQRSSESEGLSELLVHGFLGLTLYAQLGKAQPKVALSPVFRCSIPPGACVSALCPLPDGTIWLAHDAAEGDGSTQRVALYNANDGEVLRQLEVSGRVSIAKAGPGDWVYCVGKRSVKKVLNRYETRDAISDREETGRHRDKSVLRARASYTLLSKQLARFSLRAYAEPELSVGEDTCISGVGGPESGLAAEQGPTYINKSDSLDSGLSGGKEETVPPTTFCKVEARSLPSLWVVSETYFPVSVQQPLAIDVDSGGQYFAALTAVPTPSVLLFQPGSGLAPTARYAPRAATDDLFCPSDLCFAFLHGKEVLVVADWFSSALHVLECRDHQLRFQGFLGGGCPLLRQPTALVSDVDRRLWVGCKGGQVLVCLAGLDNPESDSEEEAEEDTVL